MAFLQIFIIILLLFAVLGGMAFVLLNQKGSKKKRALSVITGDSNFGDDQGHKAQNEAQNKRRAEIAKKLKETREEELEDGKKDKVTTALMLERAGLSMSPKQFWMASFASMFVCILLAKVTGQAPQIIILAAIVGLLGLPKFVVRRMTNKRQKQFLTEFPDALEASVRLLKAGMPVSEAISMVAKEFDGPVGEEMERIYDKQKIGVALQDAAFESTKRMPLAEMQMFATGLAIQAQTGSSLSEVLMNLAGVIRARFRLKRKVKALSSEAIASASIIGALPILVMLGMWFGNPDYINILFTEPFGRLLLTGAVIWMVIGCFVMKAMINFKI